MHLKKISIWIIVLSAIISSCNNKPKQAQYTSDKLISSSPVPEWSNNAVIYEVNVRQFTKEGTFNAFTEHLPRLKDLGVDILWLMPIHPIGLKNRKGNLGSYYSIQNYKEINPEFGTIDDFKKLVHKAHNLGMKVILDWVANHTAWDHDWITQNPHWYSKDSLGNMVSPYDWTDVAQLDYANQELRTAMIDALEFWVRETGVDGYRCDVAGMVPVNFWEDARKALEKIKPVYMLAEDEGVTELLVNAFNSNYGWSLHHIMNHVAQGKMNVTEMKKYFHKTDSIYPVGSYPMHFTSNHDENSWNGTEFERMGNAAKTFAVLSFVIEGIPLIYTGQESALDKKLSFFEKDLVAWDNYSLTPFYKSLTQLKKENKALWNGPAGGKMKIIDTTSNEQILFFSRTKDNNTVYAIFNLSPTSASLIAQTEIHGELTEYFTNREISFPFNGFLLQPWEYLVFSVNNN